MYHSKHLIEVFKVIEREMTLTNSRMRNSLFHRYIRQFEIGFYLLMNPLKDNRNRLIQLHRRETLDKKNPSSNSVTNESFSYDKTCKYGTVQKRKQTISTILKTQFWMKRRNFNRIWMMLRFMKQNEKSYTSVNTLYLIKYNNLDLTIGHTRYPHGLF